MRLLILLTIISFVFAECKDGYCFKNTTYCLNDLTMSPNGCICQPGSLLETASDGTFACVSQPCMMQGGSIICNSTDPQYCCGDGLFINFDVDACFLCSPKIIPGQITVPNCNGSSLTCNNDTSCKATKPYCGVVNGYPMNFTSYDCFLYEQSLNTIGTYKFGYFGTCCSDINSVRLGTCDSTTCDYCNECFLLPGWYMYTLEPGFIDLLKNSSNTSKYSSLKNRSLKNSSDTSKNFTSFIEKIKNNKIKTLMTMKSSTVFYDECYENQLITYNINISDNQFCYYNYYSDVYVVSNIYYYNLDQCNDNYPYGCNFVSYTCTNVCTKNSVLSESRTCENDYCCECPSNSIKCNLEQNGLCYNPPSTSCYSDGVNFFNIIGSNCDCRYTKVSDYPCPSDCGGLDNYAVCPDGACNGRCSLMENQIPQTTCIGLNITNNSHKKSHSCLNDDECHKCNKCSKLDNIQNMGVNCIDTVLDGKCSTILYYQCGSCLYTGPQQNCACTNIVNGTNNQQICTFCPTGFTLDVDAGCISSQSQLCHDGVTVCSPTQSCCYAFGQYYCTDISSDPNNCGGCFSGDGDACPCGVECVEGSCLNAEGSGCGTCTETENCCNSGCQGLNSIDNCGSCDSPDSFCDGLGTSCCDGVCVNLVNQTSGDSVLCGSCAISCDSCVECVCQVD